MITAFPPLTTLSLSPPHQITILLMTSMTTLGWKLDDAVIIITQLLSGKKESGNISSAQEKKFSYFFLRKVSFTLTFLLLFLSKFITLISVRGWKFFGCLSLFLSLCGTTQWSLFRPLLIDRWAINWDWESEKQQQQPFWQKETN